MERRIHTRVPVSALSLTCRFTSAPRLMENTATDFQASKNALTKAGADPSLFKDVRGSVSPGSEPGCLSVPDPSVPSRRRHCERVSDARLPHPRFLMRVITCGEASRTRSWHRRISGHYAIPLSFNTGLRGSHWYGNPEDSIKAMAGAISRLM